MEHIKVVFRKWPNGDILALFPEISTTINGEFCQSYEHIGQHGGANYGECINKTQPTKPYECQDLLQELRRIYQDYQLVIRQRYTRK